MGKFLRRRLLAMDVGCEVYEKRRCAICGSVYIVINVCTYPKCRFDLSRSSEVKDQGQIWKGWYGFLLVVNSNHERRTHRLGDIGDFRYAP